MRVTNRARLSAVALIAVGACVSGLAAPAYASPAHTTDCETFAGVELCGPVLAKYQELGGPEGSLGDPIAPPEAPNTRAASGSTRVEFTGGGGIYSSAIGGARYLGEAMFAKYAELDYEASNLGVPVSDEIDNDGESAATYGSRRADFSNGALYLKDGQVGLGVWSTYVSATTPAVPRATPLPPGSQPETCPANTSAYEAPNDIYDCLSADTQIDGYNAGVRRGVPDPTPGEVLGSGPLTESGFGLAHADVDHNVGYRAIRLLLIRDDLAPELENPVNLRYRQTLAFEFNDVITESLTAIVQRADDEFDLAPDEFDIGLISAFCADGSDPVKFPGTPHIGGRCPNDLPSPFGKDTGGSFPP